MTHPSLSTIAKRAFYEAMKAGGESEAMWIAAADAVIEECAKVADRLNHDEAKEHLGEVGMYAVGQIAEAIRALKGNANG